MAKPTLLQTLLNRPSQTYAFPQEKHYHSNRQEMLRIAAEARERSTATPSASSDSGYTSSKHRARTTGGGVIPRSSTMDIGLGPMTHVPPSSTSHASQSTSASVVSTTTSSTSTQPSPSPPPPPPPPSKTQIISEPVAKLDSSRNIILNPDNVPQRRTDSVANASTHFKTGPPQNSSYTEDEDDEDDDGSTQDVFYTPNSSPRASLASSVSIPMLSATAATTTARKVSRRSLRGSPLAQEHSSSYQVVNETSEDADGNPKQNHASPSPSTKNSKANSSSNPILTTSRGNGGGITSTEPASSRTPAPALPSPPSSTRIAVPSTRTPSRSNSLNKGRPSMDPRSGLGHGSTGYMGQGQGPSQTQAQTQVQAQGRTTTTASIVSTTSSMSSNTLDGHSVVFSDLVTDTTRATTPLPDGSNDARNGSKMGTDAMRRWVNQGANDAAKATTTPKGLNTATTSISQSKRRPNKSHTYHGLGVGLTSANAHASSSTASAFTNATLYPQHQYQQYHRNRDNKAPSVMMSMTAVLEAAEEDELYRTGKKGGVGTPAWKARQLLKHHMNGSRKGPVVDPRLNVGVNTNSKGKGKEREGVDTSVRPVRRLTGMAEVKGSTLGKGKGRERDPHSTPYAKHQPITSSPLAVSSKPLPTPGSSPPPRNNSFLLVPTLSRPKLEHRRSRSLGAESMPVYQRSDSPTPFRSHGAGASSSDLQPDSALPRAHGHTRAHSTSHRYGSSSATSANATDTVDLTAIPRSSGELPSKGTAGYTSLVLPRAPPPLNLDPNATHNGFGHAVSLVGGRDGKIDLTRDGMAQTTMASVEVVRGLGSVVGRKGLMGMLHLPLVRRKTVPAKVGYGVGEKKNEDGEHVAEAGSEGVGGLRGVGGGASVLGFTSYRKPPEYVPSGGVLVQVWAVGVDGVDGRLVGVRMMHGGGAHVSGDVAPSPVTAANVDRDPGAVEEGRRLNEVTPVEVNQKVEDESKVLEGGRDKPQTKGAGLGRSLSLRERLSRSVSLGRTAGKEFLQQHRRQYSPENPSPLKASSQPQSPEKQEKQAPSGNAAGTTWPGVGYIPGRSFVGRVVECGWEVRDEVVRKGDWVAGLLDIKKAGALTEFIVVDRHRVHRVPHPKLSTDAFSSMTFSSPPSPASSSMLPQHSLSLEELALLPLCGIPAYRAVRTFTYAFSSMRNNPSISSVSGTSDMAKHRPAGLDPHSPLSLAAYGTMISRLNLGDHENGRRRRVLVLRGHDGIGAMAVQMLVLRGWRVFVHVPFIASPPNVPTTSAIADAFMEEVEERIRKWGAEEVIFDDGEVVGQDEGRGAVVRVVDGLREDGDVFDAVLDTIGGKEVREAAERLLRSPGRRVDSDEGGNGGGKNGKGPTRGMGQFTTVVGDNPERVIPSAGDLFRAGLRSLRFGGGGGGSSSIVNTERGSSENVSVRSHDGKGGKVGYAWVNISQDVDWEGKGVGETIGSVLELALEYGIKPWVGTDYATVSSTDSGRRGTPPPATLASTSASAESGVTSSRLDPGHWEGKRIVPFEKAPEVFVDGSPLTSGGTVVVKIAT